MIEGMKVTLVFTLGEGNPYVGLLHEALTKEGCEVRPYRFLDLLGSAPDILHLHWPESVLKGSLGSAVLGFLKVFAVLSVARVRGIPIIWTVHNLGNHEPSYPRLERDFLRLLSRRIDGWISMSEEAAVLASGALPALGERPLFVVPHGHYRDAYPRATSRRKAREALQIPAEAEVFLFFGQIRPYKNVPELIRTFQRLDSSNVRLIVAGEDKSGRGEDVGAVDNFDNRVIFKLRRIPEADVAELFAAADLCVLPFADVLNSGSVILSLSMGTPVLVPEDAPFDELRRQAGRGWVRTYEGRLTPSVLETNIKQVQRLNGRPNLASLEWNDIGRATADAYESLSRQRRVTKRQNDESNTQVSD